jgi:Outer membrane protein beta-barrel domain
VNRLTCRFLILATFLSSTCVAQQRRLSFGFQGGWSLTEPSSAYRDESRRYLVGGAVEYRFFRNISAEVNFLYRRSGFSNYVKFGFPEPVPDQTLLSESTLRVRADVLELPVMFKYHFRQDARLQPFLLTGYSFRKAWEQRAYSAAYRQPDGSVRTEAFKDSDWSPIDVGSVFGAGLRWSVGRIALQPEFRYTYWGAERYGATSNHQADLLLGIRF